MGTLTAYTRLVANEPSVGMYFVQEHVRKSVPFVVSAKVRGALHSCTETRAARSHALPRQARLHDAAKQTQLCKCVWGRHAGKWAACATRGCTF